MESKKYVALKLFHLFLMIVAICLQAYALVSLKTAPAVSPIAPLLSASAIAALVLGVVYLGDEYRKNAAFYYKAFMWLLLAAQVFQNAQYMVAGSQIPALLAVLSLVTLVLYVFLAVGKDMGKTKTILMALIVVAVKLAFAVWAAAGDAAVSAVTNGISEAILALVTSFMVCGKYMDKTARGTK